MKGLQSGQGMDHISCRERLREQVLLSLKKRQLQGNFIAAPSTYTEVFKKVEQGFLQWYTPGGQKTKGRISNKESRLDYKGKLFHSKGSQAQEQVA